VKQKHKQRVQKYLSLYFITDWPLFQWRKPYIFPVMSVFKPNLKLGILGGGQLGQMMQSEAIALGIKPYFLDPNEECSVSAYTNRLTVGDFSDFDTVYEFGKDKDVITVEIEHVNVEALEKLESEGVRVHPSSQLLRIVQDKGLQKQFYADNNIPTSPFTLIKSPSDINSFPCVQKLRTGGYDGKGVQILKLDADREKAFDAPSVIEDLVDVEVEIAVIVARDITGHMVVYPVVEMVFDPDTNLVTRLIAPSGIAPELQAQAENIALDLAEKIDAVGLLAVEMFLSKTGKIIVNEIAPRPHNSGHHTIEANYTSQFAQHLRAVCGMELGSVQIVAPAVMINLLGDKDTKPGKAKYEGFESILETEGAFLHLYGKTDVKPARKMGHLTVLDPDIQVAIQKAEMIQDNTKIVAE